MRRLFFGGAACRGCRPGREWAGSAHAPGGDGVRFRERSEQSARPRVRPRRDLYVAEGGLGGTLTTTPVQCDQVVPPVGPYSGDFTARISKIGPGGGAPTTVASGLPSSQTSPALGSLVSGVADVAFVGNTLYALLAGAGCSHGLLGTENAVVRVNTNGSTTWSLI
jgi:hypothetical protein